MRRLLQVSSPYGGSVHALPGDVTDPAHRRALANLAAEQGGLDLLVNNASDLGVSPLPKLADYPLGRLAELYNTNIIAPFGDGSGDAAAP